VKLGDIIPADARLLEGDPLKIDQVIAKVAVALLLCVLVDPEGCASSDFLSCSYAVCTHW
jgi:hypothetical protein